MQIKIFTIPVLDGASAEEEMNAFMRSHRVLEVSREFFTNENGTFFVFCVRYIEGKPLPLKTNAGSDNFSSTKKSVDYKEILSPECFAVFSNLRECRNQIAKDDAIPAYAVFTNEELSNFSNLIELNEQSMKTVEGVGEKKMEKYGKRMLELYTAIGKPNETNSLFD